MVNTGARRLTVIAIICSLLCLSSCALNPIARDLVTYVNRDILDITQLETRALQRYAAVTGKNYRNKEAVLETLKTDVIPVYKQFLSLLRNLRPETDEVRRLHARYVRAAEMMYNGFKMKKLGIQKMDMVLIRTSNGYIEKGRIEIEKWQKTLDEMLKKNKVKKGK